jgi:DNA ligase-1
MKQFAQLFYDLDQTNKTNEKVDVILEYLKAAPDDDKIWMVALFTGRRPRRTTSSTLLRQWASEISGIPAWLFDECYSVVGDLSETISLLLPQPVEENTGSLTYWINYVQNLEDKPEPVRKTAILDAWETMTPQERFVFNKITSSTFRVGVSQNLVVRALSLYSGMNTATLMHRLMGKWNAGNMTFKDLLNSEGDEDKKDESQPYPFFLAHALEDSPEKLGDPHEWQAEWKWDGIRSQLIKRSGKLYIWSRGEDLVTDKFPELKMLEDILPDGTVIDGELLPFSEGKILSFNILQTRLGRKNLNAKILKEAPVAVFAYDLLEWENEDIREQPLIQRRMLLESIVKQVNFVPYLQLSPVVDFDFWDELAEKRKASRNMLAEGIMLKQKISPYRVGRKRGDWWKWKIDPLSIDAVLIYAQSGSGRRANLYTDYTFGVWNGNELVTFAKAYSGLTDKEIAEVDKWIRKNTIEKFGPVRTVKPELVFEIGFEGIQRSNRHKSGVALRFPRILRWRTDKPKEEADTLETLNMILKVYEEGN